MRKLLSISSIAMLVCCAPAAAQVVVLYNFDNAPVYTPLPVDVVVDGVTAHLSGTGQSYSIQSVSTAPVVPVGFTGHFVYPSSIYLADLLISFSQTVTAFSIVCSPQELACDDSATLRVTAYNNSAYVGTQTAVTDNPGTWPSTLVSCTFAQGFNNVVVHYDSPPPTCSDYGTIFLADNMTITVASTASVTPVGTGCGGAGVPVLTSTLPGIGQNITFTLAQGTPHASGFLFYSAVPAAPYPLGSGCVVQVELASVTPLIPVSANAFGSWSSSFLLPFDPALVGIHLMLQVALYPTSGPVGFDLSNGLNTTIGY